MHSLKIFALAVALLFSMATWAGRSADPTRILAVAAGANGSLWILGEDKLQRISDGTRQTLSLPGSTHGMRAFSLAVSAEGTVYIAGEGLGIYRSIDDGRTWKKIGIEEPGNGVNSVVAHSTLEEVVYANQPGNGLFRSKDRGENWERVDSGPQEPIVTFLHSDMAGSMETGWLFAATERGVARSMDCFCFWSDAGELRGKVAALAYDAKAPTNVYATVRDTLYHSSDGGENWSQMAAPGDVSGLAVAEGQLYAGTSTGLFVQTGKTWERVGD